jgi:nucleolar protein 9
MAASFYGKFFARRLNIYLLQRDPEQWKNLQINNKSTSQAPTPMRVQSPPATQPPKLALTEPPAKTKKRKGDEIDQLFEEKLGKKVKKAVLGSEVPTSQAAVSPEEPKERKKDRKRRKDEDEDGGKDKNLRDILGAIKAAPKDDKSHKRKKKAVA